MRGLLLACVCVSLHPLASAQAMSPAAGVATQASSPAAEDLAEARRIVSAATQPAPPWNGPRAGPPAAPGKHIAIVDEDLRNGGVLGVVDGVVEAAKVVGWTVKVFDAGGTPEGRQLMLANALAARPDGLLLVGSDAHSLATLLQPFARQGIPVVGWHVAVRPGPVSGTAVAMNVSTDPLEVAHVAALAATVQSGGHAGVVIFTDTSLELPKAKAEAMAAAIRTCGGCKLLEIRDLPISRSPELMPGATRELLARYGDRWTSALAINDIYFDYATPVLTQAGRNSVALRMISAGDGSESAFLRIRNGAFQTATVAEPLTLHGWQLVDEMNRLLAGEPVTGYVFPVHLVTAENIGSDGGDRLLYDPANGYRDLYRRVWLRR